MVNKKDSSPNARKLRWEQLMARHKGAIDVELGKAFETDDFDVIDNKHEANERTLCGRVEVTSRGGARMGLEARSSGRNRAVQGH